MEETSFPVVLRYEFEYVSSQKWQLPFRTFSHQKLFHIYSIDDCCFRGLNSLIFVAQRATTFLKQRMLAFLGFCLVSFTTDFEAKSALIFAKISVRALLLSLSMETIASAST